MAHAAFDVLWKGRHRRMRRSAAYEWLAKRMGLALEHCHMRMFGKQECLEVIRIMLDPWRTV